MGFTPTRNPWNLERSSGGSSGGAAAAVASGMVPVAHASDGGGSIRIPSANCGLFGLKPSRGRMLPNRPSTWAIDISVSHVVSRSVRDSAALFAATERTGPDAPFTPIGLVSQPLNRPLKIGLVMNTGGGQAPNPEVRAAVEGAARLLESLGHAVEPTALPMDGARFGFDFTVLWASGAAELVAAIGQALGRKPDTDVLEPFSLAMAELVSHLTPDVLPAAIARLNDDMKAYDTWLTTYDVILSPVLGQPPVELGHVAGWVPFPDLQQRLNAYVGYTPVQNVAGAPAMSVPLHWTADGLPVGVQIAGRAGGEATLLALAYQLEEAQPWAHRRPPVSV
jgi:amidase